MSGPQETQDKSPWVPMLLPALLTPSPPLTPLPSRGWALLPFPQLLIPIEGSHFWFSVLSLPAHPPLPRPTSWPSLFCRPCPVWTLPGASGSSLPHIYDKNLSSTRPRLHHILIFVHLNQCYDSSSPHYAQC